MSKNIRSFSEKITTGSRTTFRSTPRSSFFRNYQEVELEMGTKDWQKLLQGIRKWKKEGGTLKAKLKGKKESIKMKVKVAKMPILGPFIHYSKNEIEKFRKQGFTIKEINSVQRLGRSSPKHGYTRHIDPQDWTKGGDAWTMIKTWGFVDTGPEGLIHDDFPLYAEPSISPSLIRFHQAGMNYHPAVGYY